MEHKTPKIWSPKEIPFPPPKPIPIKECECGCGYAFQPRRRDHIYLDTVHANYGYNHGKRKEKDEKAKELNKKLATNDRILKKYHDAYHVKPVVVDLINLKADGFRDNLFLSIGIENNETSFYLYHFAFVPYKNDNQTLVKILKIKKNESN
jgi:hypothetical protein